MFDWINTIITSFNAPKGFHGWQCHEPYNEGYSRRIINTGYYYGFYHHKRFPLELQVITNIDWLQYYFYENEIFHIPYMNKKQAFKYMDELYLQAKKLKSFL